MAEFPAMPLWTDAYISDTLHLSAAEHGAYLLLLMAMWRNGGVLPNDDKTLARISRLSARQWVKSKPTLMRFMVFDGKWISQPKLQKTLSDVRKKSTSQAAKAKAKWRKYKNTNDATASLRHVPPDANQNQISNITTSEYRAEDAPLAHLTGERRSAEAVPEGGKRDAANGNSEIPISAELAAIVQRRARAH